MPENVLIPKSTSKRKAKRNRVMRENIERWMELARLASVEQDPDKLLELVL
jgi:hypothetical protein